MEGIKQNDSPLINSKRKTLVKNLYRYRQLYLLILPAVIAVFIFHYIPLYGVQIAFRNYSPKKGILGSPWAGMKYFQKFIKYPYFGRMMWNTFWISFVSLLVTFPLSIVFALMLNELRNQKLKKISQTVTYAPYFVSTVVVCSMVILFTSRDGLINTITAFFGAEKAVNYLADPKAFAWIYAFSGLWSTLGWSTIIFNATLAGVSMELVEAAKMDGATRLGIIWHVYLPHLRPTIITLFILRVGSLLSVGFEKTLLLQNSLNLEASSVIATYTYEVGLLKQNFSYSTAIGLFNNIINIIMLIIANFTAKKVSDTSLW